MWSIFQGFFNWILHGNRYLVSPNDKSRPFSADGSALFSSAPNWLIVGPTLQSVKVMEQLSTVAQPTYSFTKWTNFLLNNTKINAIVL